MSLNHGRNLVSIPGPSVIPDRVLSAMHRAMPNIYEGALVETSDSVLNDLPAIAKTTGAAFMPITNGHGAWEMALTNTLSRGDKVLVLDTGRFANGWGEMGKFMGLVPETISFAPGEAVDPAVVEQRLREDKSHEIKAVLVVQIDTASSVWNDIAALRKAIDAAGHPALYFVDCIASLGCTEYRMDDWGVDITVGGSQKGLMVPPGLGMVWAGKRALEAHESADLRTAYWDFTARMKEGAHYLRYCGTPPIQHIYAMREALDMINEEGLENVWTRHATFANAVRTAVEAWSTQGGLQFYVANPASRGNSTTSVKTGEIDAIRLRAICDKKAGLTLGIGLGKDEASTFRIGHMGHLNPPMVLGTLATVESALTAMGAPMGGSGIAAAAKALAPALDAESVPAGVPSGRP
ncbi:aminotransferase class V-fold PLP-dependent enzyme [Rhodobacteraceae bacterium NNCM2]|nr:aminotransferase class V-fold PLP-dependent enzyme [Coraliihabitans acroporae]